MPMPVAPRRRMLAVQQKKWMPAKVQESDECPHIYLFSLPSAKKKIS
jgi:hypothetical protein